MIVSPFKLSEFIFVGGVCCYGDISPVSACGYIPVCWGRGRGTRGESAVIGVVVYGVPDVVAGYCWGGGVVVGSYGVFVEG